MMPFEPRQAVLKAISRSILSIDRRLEREGTTPDARAALRDEREALIEARSHLEQEAA